MSDCGSARPLRWKCRAATNAFSNVVVSQVAYEMTMSQSSHPPGPDRFPEKTACSIGLLSRSRERSRRPSHPARFRRGQAASPRIALTSVRRSPSSDRILATSAASDVPCLAERLFAQLATQLNDHRWFFRAVLDSGLPLRGRSHSERSIAPMVTPDQMLRNHDASNCESRQNRETSLSWPPSSSSATKKRAPEDTNPKTPLAMINMTHP